MRHIFPGFEGFAKVKPLRKGWSGDKKYIVEDKDGRRLLLRVSDIKKQAEKKTEFEMMGRVDAHGIPTPAPVDFGVCNGGKQVYSLMTWIEGRDAGAVLSKMPEREQYLLGKKAGALQRAIHEIPVRADAEDWSVWFGRRVQEKLDVYYAHERALAGAAPCADYLLNNKELLTGRPQVFYHGDLNPTNVILMSNGGVAAIDYCTYERHGFDPVREFCTIPWGKNPNPYYYTGVLDGYYEGLDEHEFLAELAVLAYYFAYEAVWAIVDARDPHCNMKKECRKHMKNVLRWYDGMKNPVPSWYMKELKHAN